MKKIYHKIKGHLQGNATLITQHLRSNEADGYIWFLFMTVAFLLIFGALFTVMTTAINMREIRTSIDQATMDMFAEIRKLDYKYLVDGNTDEAGWYGDESYAMWHESDYLYNKLSSHLGATYNNSGLNPYIYKLDTHGNLDYQIENIKCLLLDDTIFWEESYDLNYDGVIDNLDLDVVVRTVNGEEIPEVESWQADINQDGEVNAADISCMNAVIEYYTIYHNTDQSMQRNSILLIVSFDVTVPIQYGSIDFGESTDTYTYNSLLSFKPAQ